MKKNLIVFTLILFCKMGYGQTLGKKGTWIFGFNPFNYSILQTNNSASYIADTLERRDTSKSNGFGTYLQFGAGYFIKDNLCIGARFSNEYPGNVAISTQLFVRYYFLKHQYDFSFVKTDNTRRGVLFIEGVIKGSYRNSNSDNSVAKGKNIFYSYGGVVSLGYTYLLSKRIALETMLMYNYSTYTSTGGGTNKITNTAYPSSKNIGNSSGFNVVLGIQGYF